MKGKINRAGFLKLKRGIEYKVQCCKKYREEHCGDYCLSFKEPKNIAHITIVYPERKQATVKLKICDEVLYFTNFVDERK